MKLPLMAALAALTFWGCANQSENQRPDDTAQTDTAGTGGAGQAGAQDAAQQQQKDEQEAQESPLEAGDVVDNERRDREGAPTVYDGEATGGSGSNSTVTTEDGQKWDVMEEPGTAREPRTDDSKPEEGIGGSGTAPEDGVSGDNTGGVSGGGGQAGGAAPGGSGGGSGGSGGGGGGGGGGGF
ncbi:MAG TPA: hypothetical protein VE153_25270 [Myxococcus sp.]|jgi:hypothetical protein|nr:hypothetical protein [Myxococcus sp.]